MAGSLTTTVSSIFTLLSVEVVFPDAAEAIKPYLTAHSVINDSYLSLGKSVNTDFVAFHIFVNESPFISV